MFRSRIEYHIPTTRYNSGWLWLPVAGLLGAVYLTANVTVRETLPGELNVLVLQPMLWIMVTAICSVIWRYGLREKPHPNAGILARSFALGLFQIGAWLLAGLIFGFGLSPYGREISILLGNLLFAVTALIGMEMARACVVVSLGYRNQTLALAVTAGLFTVISIPLGTYGSVVDVPSTLRLAGEGFLPTLSQNLLASVLVLAGGPAASLLYRGVIVSFEWLFPILPDLGWMATAFFGTMPAALGLLVIEKQLKARGDEAVQPASKNRRLTGMWVAAAAISVTLLFFNAGYFGYRPTLIVGPSMVPSFETGDIVITSPVDVDTIEMGDVVRFRTETGAIVHRVVEIQGDGVALQFITRGDGNNTDDPPVLTEQIEGRVILVIPKLGWPAILFREAIQWLSSL